MTSEELKKELSLCGIAPVIVIDDADNAVETANALLKGGVWFMEITFRTPAASEAIKKVSENVPKMIVGAGTVINIENAKKAVDAGAKFIVTPGYIPELVEWCSSNNIPIIPGTTTMSEICWAINAGCDTVKFFPAVDAGGVKYMKSINSVFPFLKFMPSGGIGLNNFKEFASYSGVAAATGSWLAPRDLIMAHKFEDITEICRNSVLQMHDFKLLHIGINNRNEETALNVAKSLSELLSEPLTDKGTAYFVGTMADVIKHDSLPGPNGHIAIECNNVDRAVRFFEDRGYRFSDVGKNKDEKGLTAIWFDEAQVNIGGFAVHLKRKE